jgi:hypothetical protein
MPTHIHQSFTTKMHNPLHPSKSTSVTLHNDERRLIG